jgi:hypothetical protein
MMLDGATCVTRGATVRGSRIDEVVQWSEPNAHGNVGANVEGVEHSTWFVTCAKSEPRREAVAAGKHVADQVALRIHRGRKKLVAGRAFSAPTRQNEYVKTRKKINKSALFASFGVSVGLILIVLGLNSATTGRDALNLPDEIENMSPANNEKVLRQSEIRIDFIEGYEGALVVNGIEIPTTRLDELQVGGKQPKPGEQVDLPPTAIYDPGNFTLTFLPQEGAPVERLEQGKHAARVFFWKITETRDKAQSYTWEFTVD